MRIRVKESKLYSVFLAILPVIMMYRVPVIGMGFATVMIACGMAYCAIVILSNLSSNSALYLIPFIMYFVYVMTKSTGSNILLCIAILVHFYAICMGAVNVPYLRKTIEVISLIAAICVVMQFLWHSLTGNHIQMINLNWCLSEMNQYRSNILTGIGQAEPIYRPSAFFLEPSHMTNYASVGLISCLLLGRPNYIKAAAISLGVVCTTSGMGIVLVGGIWAIFPFIATKKLDGLKIKRILILLSLFLVAVSVLYQLPFFKNALNRITGSSSTYSSTQYNAIWGRTLYWQTYISPMSGKELLLGYGNSALPDVYFTGLMTIVYSYGLIGVCLLYFSLVMLLLRSKNNGCKLLLLIYGGLLPLANLTSFITMIFYLGSVLSLHYYSKYDFEKM